MTERAPPHSRSARRGHGGARAARRRRLSSTAPSARAAIRARSSTAAPRSSRSTATRRPFAAGAGLAAASGGRLRLVEARFGELDAVATRSRARRGRRRRARHRRLVDAARRGRARLFAALRRAARHAHGERRPFGRRHPARRGRGDDRRHPVSFRRGARLAPHRARHRRRPRRPRRSSSTLQLAGMIARVAPARRGELTHPATRDLPGACASRSTTSLASLLRGLVAAERLLEARRPPRGRDVPFARGPDRQAVPRRPLGPRTRRLAPPARRAGRGRRRHSRFRAASRSRRAKRRRAPIRVRARPSCGIATRLDAPPRGRDERLEALARLPARRGRSE